MRCKTQLEIVSQPSVCPIQDTKKKRGGSQAYGALFQAYGALFQEYGALFQEYGALFQEYGALFQEYGALFQEIEPCLPNENDDGFFVY